MRRMSQPDEPLSIPAAVHGAMVAHCLAEAPNEACGLLTGLGRGARTFVPLRNALASESRYEADSRDLIDAVVAMRARGEGIVAIYHSHPRWPAVPSRTDLEANHYGDVPRIIVSLLADPPEVRAWRLGPDSYEELAWEIAPPGVESSAMPE
jgi:proteasome lid subunit RPN8/RPN11